ncbi:2-dehydropantoate 2-reductase N-terminal domain-containing protein, partial [Vibrio parahaemolyticus]
MSPRICIYGAGSVGCYLGGRLLAAGASLRFVGRARIGVELAQHGLRVTDYLGAAFELPSTAIDY